MFNSSVLDVAIGLGFVYLLLGLICTTVNEWIAQFLKTRAVTLKEAIRGLLHAPPDGTYGIRAVDINLPALAKRFSKPDDKLTLVLGSKLEPIRADLDRYAAALAQDPASSPPPGLAAAVAEGLSALLDETGLDKKIDAATVTPETKAESEKQLKTDDLRRVNRALLNEAYPNEIMSLSDAFYSHALIKSLARPGEHPSYLAPRTFALTLMDILGKGEPAAGGTDNRLEQVRTSIALMPDSDVKTSLQALLRSGSESVEIVQEKIEGWFDDSMDRVSGWYKKKIQVWTIIVASIVTIFVNADTIDIAQRLMVNPALRDKIVASVKAGQNIAGTENSLQSSSTLTPEQRADLSSLTGWTQEFRTFYRLKACESVAATLRDRITCAQSDQPPTAKVDPALWNKNLFPGMDLFSWGFFSWLWAVVPVHLAGWVLTAIAASLGAPFWFDTLNKFMNVRSAGTSPDEKKTDKAKA